MSRVEGEGGTRDCTVACHYDMYWTMSLNSLFDVYLVRLLITEVTTVTSRRGLGTGCEKSNPRPQETRL